VVQHAVTIPEADSEQIVARLSRMIFSRDRPRNSREGTLLPETYKFPRGTTRDQVVQRMQQTQKRVLAEIWERRNPDVPVKTPEAAGNPCFDCRKETGKADERSRVAAVFVNRLRQKIKLQSDPTIIYGLVGARERWGGRSSVAKSSSRRLTTLRGRRPAAWADRQSRTRLAGSRGQSGAHPRSVLRCRRHRRHAFTETYDQHQKNVAKLRAMESRFRHTVEPADDPPPPAASAPADASPTATTTRSRLRRKARAARQGAAQSTASPPVCSDSAGATAGCNRIPLCSKRFNVASSFCESHAPYLREIHAMPLSSMTGFAEARRQRTVCVRMELKSVNAKALTCGCGCRRMG